MSALYQLGRDVLGPAFCAYLHAVLDFCDRPKSKPGLQIERLLFVAREGYLLQRLHALLADGLGARVRPAGSYLCLSRLSTALPSTRGLGLREVRLGLNKGVVKSIKAILSTYDLCDAPMLELVRAAGIEDAEAWIHDWWRDPDVERLIANEPVQREIAERGRRARERLKRYLAQEGVFSSKRALLVDIGWSGTIQNNLARAFADDPQFPELDGIYFGLQAGTMPGYDAGIADRKHGVLVDTRRDRGLPQRAILYFLEIFEQAARADHGTTIGYRERDGRIEPILKEDGADREAERRAEPAVAELQRGIEAHAAEYARLAGNGAHDRASSLQAAWRGLERFIFFPTASELTALGELVHTDDWGADSHRGVVATHPAALLHPGRWWAELHRAYWKPGFITRSGGAILGRAYYEYARWRPKQS